MRISSEIKRSKERPEGRKGAHWTLGKSKNYAHFLSIFMKI